MTKRYVRATIKDAAVAKPAVVTLELKDGVSLSDVKAWLKSKTLLPGCRIARVEYVTEGRK